MKGETIQHKTACVDITKPPNEIEDVINWLTLLSTVNSEIIAFIMRFCYFRLKCDFNVILRKSCLIHIKKMKM